MPHLARRTLLAAGLAFVLTPFVALPALAGPVQDFERELRAGYADYRAAIFRTNTKDKPATLAAIQRMGDKWKALSAKWSDNAPPQYAEDKTFAPTLARVAEILETARLEAEADKLPQPHETLEKIRDELGNLRRRNGVIVFSDRMNAYHEQMEKILGAKYDGLDARGLLELRDDAAILAFLLQEIAANPPADRDNGYD